MKLWRSAALRSRRLLAGVAMLVVAGVWLAVVLHPAPAAPGRGGTGVPATRQNSGVVKDGTVTKPAVAAAPADGSAAIPDGQRVIRSGRVTVLLKGGEFESKLDRLLTVVIPSTGGFVSSSNATTEGGRLRSGVVAFEVPSDRFQAAVDAVRQLGTVDGLAINGTDVSAEYVDLQARLKNQEAQRDAIAALMGRASTIQEILTVQQQLSRVQEEIERLQGRINYLEHNTSFASLTVSLREAAPASRASVDEWGLQTAAVQALHDFVGTVNAIVLLLGATGPVLLLLGGGALALWRRRPKAFAAA